MDGLESGDSNRVSSLDQATPEDLHRIDFPNGGLVDKSSSRDSKRPNVDNTKGSHYTNISLPNNNTIGQRFAWPIQIDIQRLLRRNYCEVQRSTSV
jgi:hypothetical protein